ncbi:S41 family peptidase [Zunongwangia sp. H14]|uniref:S41 family peptidase n=1 Tax=Zunongwangia sp. H14 TaxID=3240792 RepID=UPI003562740E
MNDGKYSKYYFGLFNGKKLAEPSCYYNKPVYVLTNEKTFSAASIFVAVFK